MKKRILITLFAALLFSFSISAQILKGHVYDATTNEPLAGASVTYKLKDTQGVVTDINGAYEVHLPAGGVDLVFSYVGYEDVPMPIVISKGDIMQKDVYMKESTNLLEDVVVSAGRFEQKLSDVTVSMDLIKASDIARQAPTDITSTLQTIPGVDIIDKQPSIRGGGGWTYSVGARSLVLVDGMSVLSPKTGHQLEQRTSGKCAAGRGHQRSLQRALWFVGPERHHQHTHRTAGTDPSDPFQCLCRNL